MLRAFIAAFTGITLGNPTGFDLIKIRHRPTVVHTVKDNHRPQQTLLWEQEAAQAAAAREREELQAKLQDAERNFLRLQAEKAGRAKKPGLAAKGGTLAKQISFDRDRRRRRAARRAA